MSSQCCASRTHMSAPRRGTFAIRTCKRRPMKPPPFDYYAPSTVAEALKLLRGLGPDAKPLAGGQSLVPMMNFRIVHPRYIIDLNGIPELAYIRIKEDGLRIGAMTRHREVE